MLHTCTPTPDFLWDSDTRALIELDDICPSGSDLTLGRFGPLSKTKHDPRLDYNVYEVGQCGHKATQVILIKLKVMTHGLQHNRTCKALR